MSPTLNITLIQSMLHWENNQANRDMFSKKINSISNTQLIILPETFTSGFTMNTSQVAETMEGETIQWMKQMATTKKAIITGSLVIHENNQYYNRLVWALPNGELGCYNKRHLFAYANEDKHFKAGEKRFIAQVNGWKICTQICFDLRFPVWNSLQNKNEFDVLLYIANWPEKRIQHWDALLKARAIENQCYVIAVNRVGEDFNGIYYNGHSSIISPMGEVLYCKEDEEDIFTIELDKKHVVDVRSQFPFLDSKDNFMII
ncbi:MAG: amidohydrolase [Chitinophagaceae bacterium]